jgi:hypothetical protein
VHAHGRLGTCTVACIEEENTKSRRGQLHRFTEVKEGAQRGKKMKKLIEGLEDARDQHRGPWSQKGRAQWTPGN